MHVHVGESYGGTYIPLIMKTISDNGVINNLKGAAIGNGCTQGSCFTDYNENWIDYQMFKVGARRVGFGWGLGGVRMNG